MKKTWLFTINGIVMALLGVALMPGTDTQTEHLLRGGPESQLARLEAEAAQTPSAQNTASLARAYLIRQETGLALAAIDALDPAGLTPPDSAALELLRAQALLAAGQTELALNTAEGVARSCELDQRAAAGCPSWVVLKGLQIERFARELVRAGINDVARDPAGTEAAFARSQRAVQLVAAR